MQTPILLNSKAHSKDVLYPRKAPYNVVCKTAKAYKYSRASVMSELKTSFERGMSTPIVTCQGRLSQGQLETLV